MSEQVTIDGDAYLLLTESPYKVCCYRDGSVVRRCIGTNGRPSTHFHTVEWIVWLMPQGAKNRDYHVYMYQPSAAIRAVWKKLPKIGYVVARDMETAKKQLANMFAKSAKRRSGLGKDALTETMKQLNATSNVGKYSGANRSSLNKPGRIVVNVRVGNGEYQIYAADNLYYAAKAVNGGQSGVQRALMSAANGVNGAINAYIRNHGSSFFDEGDDFAIWKAPFEEVVKR